MSILNRISDWWHRNVAIKTYGRFLYPVRSRAEELSLLIYKRETKLSYSISIGDFGYFFMLSDMFNDFYIEALKAYAGSEDYSSCLPSLKTARRFYRFLNNKDIGALADFSYIFLNIDLKKRFSEENEFYLGNRLHSYLLFFDEHNPEMLAEVLYLYFLYRDTIVNG